MKHEFAKNLRYLCAETAPVAQICREIGFVQQQFSKYLNGSTMPSAFSLRRICDYFDLTEAEILAPHTEFSKRKKLRNLSNARRIEDPFSAAFPGDLAKLRPLLGAYHFFYKSPSWPGSVFCSATFLEEQDGEVIARTIERGLTPNRTKLQRSRFSGKAGYHGSRIFIVEFEKEHDGAIVETILYPPHRQNKQYLKGLSLGLAWNPRRTPFSSPVIFRKVPKHSSPKEMLRKCGIYSFSNPIIDPIIRGYLNDEINFFGTPSGLAS